MHVRSHTSTQPNAGKTVAGLGSRLYLLSGGWGPYTRITVATERTVEPTGHDHQGEPA
jgi:hypothetical protein